MGWPRRSEAASPSSDSAAALTSSTRPSGSVTKIASLIFAKSTLNCSRLSGWDCRCELSRSTAATSSRSAGNSAIPSRSAPSAGAVSSIAATIRRTGFMSVAGSLTIAISATIAESRAAMAKIQWPAPQPPGWSVVRISNTDNASMAKAMAPIAKNCERLNVGI